MELIYLSLLFFVLSVCLSLHYLLYKHRSHFSSPNLPPGRTGWPIIGESMEFLFSGWKGQPEKFIFERMAKYSNQVFKTSLMGEPAAVFCGVAGHKFLYTNENKHVTAWWPASIDKIFPTPLESSNEEAKKMRKLLPQFLKPEALQGYIGIMDTIAQRHLASDWDNKQEVTVYPLVKEYTFWLACRLFVSIDDPSHVAKLAEPFNLICSALFAMPIDLPGTPFHRGVKASVFVRNKLLAIIKQRKADLAEKKASPTQDILSHMLLTSDETGQFMTEMDIANKILGLLIGGHGSASATITFIIKYLAELPEIYDQVYKEQMEIVKSKAPNELLNWNDIQKMKYSWNVACEVMRLAPPQQGAFRIALHDFVYAGFSIPKGWKLYWSTHSTHRDPQCFAEPEKFDPNRFEGSGPAPYTYVPFGGGPRMCPGKEYARLETLVFMNNIVKKFKWEKLLPDEKIVL
ncbi:hypothetical protein L1049_019780 [Liquidambar formosana]|uniref:Cytochrome P450 n=1 Tax=Liquidambar formosana TaxID=63359 RepID=A0AAP0SC49_LIQFO